MKHLTKTILNEIISTCPIFTTAEASAAAGSTTESAVRALRNMEETGLVTRLTKGVWGVTSHPDFSPYAVVPYLLARSREADDREPEISVGWDAPIDLEATTEIGYTGYVSFISALHLHGMLSQIPREIHVAVITQRRSVKTPVAAYVFHQIARDLFGGAAAGDRWGRFAIATPAKAVVDTLYLSTKRGKQFGHLPEIELPYARTDSPDVVNALEPEVRMRRLSVEVSDIIARIRSARVRSALSRRWYELRAAMERDIFSERD